MSGQLCRVTMQLIAPHEKRRGDHPRLPRCDGDILRSLAYWRQVRRTSPHCDQQYRMHRKFAMQPVRLPHDFYADPLFREAKRDCDAAIQNFQPIAALFDSMFVRKAA